MTKQQAYSRGFDAAYYGHRQKNCPPSVIKAGLKNWWVRGAAAGLYALKTKR